MSYPTHQSPELEYYLGCPQWTHRPWQGSIYPKSAPLNDALFHYSHAFNCVEGNTTFYAAPPQSTIEKWAEKTPLNFRFLLKFPKSITHDALLQGGAIDDAHRFIDSLKPLQERCTHLFLQLSPRLTLNHLEHIHRFLIQLPLTHQYVLEIRDPQACTLSGMEEFHSFLTHHHVERVWMDTRPLRNPDVKITAEVERARQRKPNLPVYPIGLGPYPVIRYVAHPQVEKNQPWIQQWAEIFADWIQEGKKPFFFAHYPGETYAPQVARLFHETLQTLITLPALPIWKGEHQVTLF